MPFNDTLIEHMAAAKDLSSSKVISESVLLGFFGMCSNILILRKGQSLNPQIPAEWTDGVNQKN